MLRALLQRNGTQLLGGLVLYFIWFANGISKNQRLLPYALGFSSCNHILVFGLSCPIFPIVCSSRVRFYYAIHQANRIILLLPNAKENPFERGTR